MIKKKILIFLMLCIAVFSPVISSVYADTGVIMDELTYFNGNDSYGNYALAVSDIDESKSYTTGNYVYTFYVSSSSVTDFPIYDVLYYGLNIDTSIHYKILSLNGNAFDSSQFPACVISFFCDSSDSYIRLSDWSDSDGDHIQFFYSSSSHSPLRVQISLPYSINNISNMVDMDNTTQSNITTSAIGSNKYSSMVYDLLKNNTLPSNYIFGNIATKNTNIWVVELLPTLTSTRGVYYTSNNIYFMWGYFITRGVYINNFTFDSFKMSNSLYIRVDESFTFSNIVNSLVVYNYNNNYLTMCNGVSYLMHKDTSSDNDYQGYLFSTTSGFTYPSYKYTTFVPVKYSNVVFTSPGNVQFYISSNNVLPLLYFNDDRSISMDLGFDFNFIYSSPPLVADNSVFDLSFDKPSYKELKFTLDPFYIPVLEICENLIIFMMFYCPIISDIFTFIGLNTFISSLLTVLTFITGLPLGQFILAVITFFIFFNIVRSYMPIVYSAGGSAYNTISTDVGQAVSYIKNDIDKHKQSKKDKAGRRLINKTKVYRRDSKYKVKMKSYKPIGNRDLRLSRKMYKKGFDYGSDMMIEAYSGNQLNTRKGHKDFTRYYK